jgi:hypothetical protein
MLKGTFGPKREGVNSRLEKAAHYKHHNPYSS